MIAPVLMNKIRNDLDAWEVPVPWMYLDSEGYVTVGCGTMLPNIKSAEPINFYHDKTRLPATKSDIDAAWKKIHSNSTKQKKAVFSKKLTARYFKNETDLRLSLTEIHKLRDTHIKSDYLQLKLIYPKFDSFPDNIKIALFDMIYNLGPGHASTPHHKASGLRKFVLMNKAINNSNWADAAKHCHRLGISHKRNLNTKRLFLSAIPKKIK